jgi:hypothetical protein
MVERALGIHWTGDWVGPGASVSNRKIGALARNQTPVVQPEASVYTQEESIILVQSFFHIRELAIPVFTPSNNYYEFSLKSFPW